MLEPVYIDAIWLTIAFLCGILAKKSRLPPLIGFLLTGFLLNAFGLTQGHIGDILHILSDLGVMLLLFTIGLKINLRNLVRKEILVTAGAHMMISILALAGVVFLTGYTGMRLFTDLKPTACLLIGFALSFSSTVFAVKTLEERGELNSYHGKLAIGILVIQDLFAVLFLTLSKGEWPSLWVLTLPVYLYLVRFVLYRILDLVDHGELLTIYGMFVAFIAGALSFHMVDLKPDLGALVIGMLMVGHGRAKELYERMMSYKDFFLVAFFINIGLAGIPGWDHLLGAAVLLLFVNFKGGLFLFLFSRFNIRARTAFLASISLGNYSEFALITGVVGVEAGWIPADWVLLLALAMSLSFLATAPLNHRVHDLFDGFKNLIMRFNKGLKCVDEEPQILGNAECLVVGMGDIGQAAYRHLAEEGGRKVLGIDYDHELVEELQAKGCNALWGDATDSNLWENADLSRIKVVLLAMDDHPSNINSIREITKLGKVPFKVGVISHHDYEAEEYRELAVDYIYDYRSRLGGEFAEGFLQESA